MGGVPRASLKWHGELNQRKPHNLKVPPRHYCLDGTSDQDYLLINATLECEHTDLRVVSATRHSLGLTTLFGQ